VEIRIGVSQSMKEIEVELAEDTDRDDLKARINDVLASEHGVLWLLDIKGREVAVASTRIAYVELGSQTAKRSMGFQL